MTVHWHWDQTSPSVYEIKRGKDRIGLAVLRDKLWRCAVTHAGATGIAEHKAPINAIVVALRRMVEQRAVLRGTTRAEELAKIDKRTLELMASAPSKRVKRKRFKPKPRGEF